MLYKNTDNIGDDIQSYAAYRFLPRVDYVIDREELDKFVPEKKEKVKVIMNAWYMYNKYNFPYSPYIEPLLISMHLNYYDDLLYSEYKFLEGYTKEFITSNYDGKIGCRDMSSKKVLEDLGYKAYFSGCMTLTLDIPSKKKVSKYICAVDLNKDMVDHLKRIFKGYEIKEITHDVDPKELSRKSYTDRMKGIEEFLKVYQNATLVVTNRLHCALPCLSLKTPVLLIYYEYNENRIQIYRDYITNCSEEEFFAMDKNDLLKIKNPDRYLDLRKKLIETVEKFVSDDKDTNLESLPDIDVYRDFVKRMELKEKLFLDRVNYLNEREKEIDPLKKENYELHNENWGQKHELWLKDNEIRDLKENNEALNRDFKELEDKYNAILNSRSYKFVSKIKSIVGKKEEPK